MNLRSSSGFQGGQRLRYGALAKVPKRELSVVGLKHMKQTASEIGFFGPTNPDLQSLPQLRI